MHANQQVTQPTEAQSDPAFGTSAWFAWRTDEAAHVLAVPQGELDTAVEDLLELLAGDCQERVDEIRESQDELETLREEHRRGLDRHAPTCDAHPHGRIARMVSNVLPSFRVREALMAYAKAPYLELRNPVKAVLTDGVRLYDWPHLEELTSCAEALEVLHQRARAGEGDPRTLLEAADARVKHDRALLGSAFHAAMGLGYELARQAPCVHGDKTRPEPRPSAETHWARRLPRQLAPLPVRRLLRDDLLPFHTADDACQRVAS